MPVPAAQIACEQWATVYDNPAGHAQWGVDQAVDVAASPSGDIVYVVGHSNDAAGVRDIVTLAMSAADGRILWTARLAGPDGEEDFASAVAVAGDGRTVFIAGLLDADGGGNRGRGVVAALDASTGRQRWVATSQRGGEGGLDRFNALAASADGDTVYAVGATGPAGQFGLGLSDYLAVAYDAASGEERWALTYDGTGALSDRATDVVLAPDAGDVLYVTGSSAGTGDPRDYDTDLTTLALDAATGQRRWVHRHDGGQRGNDGAEAIAVSSDGSRVFVAGFVRVPGSSMLLYTNYAAVTLAVDAATGAQQWTATHAGPGRGVSGATALAVAGDTVVMGGHAMGQSDMDWDSFAMGVDAATGATRWLDQSAGPGAVFESAEGVAASPDGTRAYVTSFTRTGTRQDIVTAAYRAATGERVWTARWNSSPAGINYDLAGAVTATATGVYVVGSTGDEAAAQANRTTPDFNYRDIAALRYAP